MILTYISKILLEKSINNTETLMILPVLILVRQDLNYIFLLQIRQNQ